MEQNFSKAQPNDQNENIELNSNNMLYDFDQVNQIKPKQLRKLDIISLVRSNNIPELKEEIKNLSREKFEENDYFEFNKDELKLVKSYQYLIQYMMNSIEYLENKNQILSQFIDKQIDYNEDAEKVIEKQDKKIKNQQSEISEITKNCKNMEFLIQKLGLEERIRELGLRPLNNDLDEQ